MGNYHAIVLTEGGFCYTWGWGGLGQLGHGDNQNQMTPKLLQMNSIKQVTAGTSYTMIVTEFGELYAFGNNQHGKYSQFFFFVLYCCLPRFLGQLGIGTCENQNAPSKVKKLYNVRRIFVLLNVCAFVSIFLR